MTEAAILDIRIGHLNILDHLILGLALPDEALPVETEEASADEAPVVEAPADVHPMPLNSWDQICRGLESDDINAAFINIPLAMDLYDRGLDIALLMFTHRGGSRMICNSGINRIPDFKGKSVLIPHKLSVQHMLLHRFLDARGMGLKNTFSPESVCAEPVPPFLMSEMASRDKTGDIAGFICEAPFGTRALEQGRARQLLTTRDLWPDHPCSAFVVRKDLLERMGKELENLVKRFFRWAVFLDTRICRGKKDDDTPLPEGAKIFLKQRRVTTGNLVSAGISYAPEMLVPDSGHLDIILQYMGNTMGLLDAIELKDFIMPAFALKALGELDS